MRRLWPRSIAGQTTLVLILGMFGVIFLATTVFWLTLSGETRPPRSWHLASRIETLASIANRLPPAARGEALKIATGIANRLPPATRGEAPKIVTGDMRAGWFVADDRAEAAIARAWFSRRAEHRLRRALAPEGVGAVIVGRIEGIDRDFPELGPNPLAARIELGDGSWLRFAAVDPGGGPYRLFALALAVLVAAAGLTGLAVWASQRVTAPLGRFSAAAERLGTGDDAAPLAAAGPAEIERAALAFNRMQERIRRFVDDRTLMLAAISHDLRTSLTRLKLRTEFIDDEEQRRKANADIDEMQTMLAETLAFARDDTPAEATVRVDLAGLLRSLCDEMRDAGREARFDGPDRFPFACRPVALRRAFGNLIGNAAVYGREAAVAFAADDREIVVAVADRGPGIPAAMRERAFAPFFRLEGSRSRETGGAGLGLAVARNIVRHHGGDVTLEDRPGGGLTARVALPRPARV